jgi:hypothetical protein
MTKMISDELFIHELNSIHHVSYSTEMRPDPREMVHGLLKGRRSDGTRFNHVLTKDAVPKVLDIMALSVYSGTGKSDLVADYERDSTPHLDHLRIILHCLVLLPDED